MDEQNHLERIRLYIILIVWILILLIISVFSIVLLNEIHFYIIIKVFKEVPPATINALLLFVLGLLVSLTVFIVKSFSYRYRYRKLLIRLVEVAGESTSTKATEFLECANNFDINIKENFSMNSRTVVHLDNIQKVDFKVFYEAFFSGIEKFTRLPESKDAYDKIFSAISDIQSVENRYEKQFDDFIKRYNYLEEKRNNAIMDVKKIIDKMFDNAKVDGDGILPEYKQYLKSIIEIQNSWQKLKNNTLPSIFNNNYIQKIRNLNESYYDKPRVTKNIPNDLYYSLNDADNEYESLKILVETNNKVFLSYHRSYTKFSNVMTESVNILSKRKYFNVY